MFQHGKQALSLIKVSKKVIDIQLILSHYFLYIFYSKDLHSKMIQKKQPVTKQFLLSFKSSHGDFYEKFVTILKSKMDYCRQVRESRSCPNYMLAERCMFMCVLQNKHKKFKDEELDIAQLAEIFKKYRVQITKSINSQKSCILSREKNFKIQEMENIILETVTGDNFSFNSFEIQENTYIYELFKAILNRTEEVNVFGEHKYVPMTYSYLQIKQISGTFGQNIVFFDYNASKNPPTQMNFSPQTTYILKVKDKLIILYVKQPKFIEIVKEDTMTLEELQSIFTKPPAQTGFLDKILGSDQKKKEANKLFPDQIDCSKCSKKFSEFDCLKWNYEYYCGGCLESPQLNTSNIPETLIEKYFKQRGIRHNDYEILCAQCTGKTYLRKYNPAYKPQKYTCEICQHTICLQHNLNISECFCECKNCKLPTINVLNLNLAVCQKCKKKYCRTCKSASDDFCGCICKLCYELNEDGHICLERCHFCFNHISNTKTCVCGSKICYGCYYYKMKNYFKDGKLTCQGPQKY